MKILLTISILIILISCSHEKETEEIIDITHGKSFGMCEGYCYTTTKFDRKRVVKYSHAWRNEKPDKKDTIAYSNFDWNKIINAINIDSFKKLPSIIGCPDCADGGAEWIEIRTKDNIYTVKFDYNSDIEEIKTILNLLRKQ
ncbi:MAG: hypothetical protein KKH44_11810 [Bacteroidetes bacterium]|nr:hypothetical protein [Bacteroidota bacterium]